MLYCLLELQKPIEVIQLHRSEQISCVLLSGAASLLLLQTGEDDLTQHYQGTLQGLQKLSVKTQSTLDRACRQKKKSFKN